MSNRRCAVAVPSLCCRCAAAVLYSADRNFSHSKRQTAMICASLLTKKLSMHDDDLQPAANLNVLIGRSALTCSCEGRRAMRIPRLVLLLVVLLLAAAYRSRRKLLQWLKLFVILLPHPHCTDSTAPPPFFTVAPPPHAVLDMHLLTSSPHPRSKAVEHGADDHAAADDETFSIYVFMPSHSRFEWSPDLAFQALSLLRRPPPLLLLSLLLLSLLLQPLLLLSLSLLLCE